MSHTERFEYRGWTVEVQRKAFRRRVSIHLHPGRPIEVRAARLTALSTVIAFLEDRKDWIAKHLDAFEERLKDAPSFQLLRGEKYPFLGRDLELAAVPTPLNRIFFSKTDERFLLHLPSELFVEEGQRRDWSEQKNAFRAFYKREAIKYLEERVRFWSAQMKLHPRKVSFREMKTRWGSCNSQGRVCFNWRIVAFRPEVVDSIVVHELAHLKHLDHSPRFWSLVEVWIPERRELQRELREKSHIAEFLEARR